MAKKFTQLPAAQNLTSSDIIAVVNGGESKKATLDQVGTFVADSLTYVSDVIGSAPITSSGGATPTLSLGTVGIANGGTGVTTEPTNGQLLIGNGTGFTLANLTPGSNVSITSPSAGNITISATTTGATFSGALTLYIDGTTGVDAPGRGTLGAPYASIGYAYSQVSSLGNPNNSSYNGDVEKFITEKLVLLIAPGRYVENVTLGFKRARVQLVGNGVQIVGNVKMSVKLADFPASNMEALKASFPVPWRGASAGMTFEISGGNMPSFSTIEVEGAGVEADATSVPFFVTGWSALAFEESNYPGTIASTGAWENNFGQFNFYANKCNLIGGMVYTTSFTSGGGLTFPTRAFPTCVMEVDSATIGESSNPSRTYFGAVPYAFITGNTWSVGTGVATSTAAINATTLTDSTKGTLGLWTANSLANATVTHWNSAGVSQTRTILSNTTTALTVSAGWTNAIAVGDRYVISTVGTTNKVGEGTITLKAHNSTLGASIGPRLVLGELDGCRIYDIDRTMLGTVDNGSVTGSTSSSYIGLVINQFRQYSGTGIPGSQYQLGATTGATRYKLDSTSYTTLAFNRSGAGVLTARTLNFGGGVSFDFQDDSRSLAFTPTTSANWAAPAPTTVQSALDRIASAVFALRGNSAIP